MSEKTSKKKGALLGLYAQTSLHPGTGTALGTVDLPVQRERHTAWPVIGGTAIKGVLRDACREARADGSGGRAKADKEDKELVAAFGPPTDEADKHAGALSFTDARILAFPVRSLKGVFAWVSCAEVLDRLVRDAAMAGLRADITIPRPEASRASVAQGCPHLVGDSQLVLEEFDFERNGGDSGPVAEWISRQLLPRSEAFKPSVERFNKSLVVLHSDDFTHFVKYTTEVTARIKLNYDTKTVEKGALFYQEFLPPETLFYSVVLANSARSGGANALDAADVMSVLKRSLPDILQIGGDETTGKGYCATCLSTYGGEQ